MGTMMVRNNPKALALLQQNCMEHITLMAGEQIELEFVEELQKMQQMGQQMQAMMQQMGPQAQQNPQFMQMQREGEQLKVIIESRKAILIAQFTDDYTKAENEVLNQVENDPVLKLKDRELDLKAKEEQRREEEFEKDSNLEMFKVLSNRDIAEKKISETDKHQKLRASVSLAKSGIQKMQAIVGEEQ
jgi:hypothetical protein